MTLKMRMRMNTTNAEMMIMVSIHVTRSPELRKYLERWSDRDNNLLNKDFCHQGRDTEIAQRI
jgi:hypothetical protein